MRKSNEEVLAGKVGFTARARCWPHGVPGFLLYPVLTQPSQLLRRLNEKYRMDRIEQKSPERHAASSALAP